MHAHIILCVYKTAGVEDFDCKTIFSICELIIVKNLVLVNLVICIDQT